MKKGKDGVYARYTKRILDIVFAIVALILFFWLYALIAIKVFVNLGRPVLFSQQRPGKDEKLFQLYKFRSMTNSCDENGNFLPDEQRLTEFGRWIRGTSLDELPQLWNILRGDMSFIGPRPQLVRDMVFMSPKHRHRHDVRPGLSGLAQVSGRNALEWEQKLEKDIEYVQRISFLMDMSIIFKTISQVVLHKHGLEGTEVNEVDLTDDYGVFLLKRNEITNEQFDEGLRQAEGILSRKKEEAKLV